jgi:tRNA (guanine-N7-)-methyltransferase
MDGEITPLLDYHPTSFHAGRMDFAWEELDDDARAQAYADWQAGKGLIGGNPHQRPNSHLLPGWGVDRPFFRALALDDARGSNGRRWRATLAAAQAVEVEIGFGRGDFLLDRAQRRPDTLLIGYETKNKAARLCLQRVERYGIGNLWISDDDCRFSLPRVIDDGQLAAVHILFPDPWWKPGHQVKRLFSPPFVDLLAAKLQPGGLLHVKTDVDEYAAFVRYLVEGKGGFGSHDPELAAAIGAHALTHREAWCLRNQRPVDALYFARR